MELYKLPAECKNALLALLPVVESYENLLLIQSIVDKTGITTQLEIKEIEFLKFWLSHLDKTRTLHKDLLPLYKLFLNEIN